jgi:hypothetical protein
MTTKVEAWAKDAEQGDRFVYHVGTFAGGDECRAAMALHEGGLVLLLRKRKEGHLFNYIAHRTGKKV